MMYFVSPTCLNVILYYAVNIVQNEVLHNIECVLHLDALDLENYVTDFYMVFTIYERISSKCYEVLHYIECLQNLDTC